LEVEELHGPRFEVALQLFAAGERLTFRNATFRLAEDGYLDLYVRSNWLPEHITRQAALEELSLGQAIADYVVQESPSFASIVDELHMRFVLYSESGWHDTTDICRLVDGELVWSEALPE
jgi:hypothetical protein